MQPNKLTYVDTMRGWAILLVIACHQAVEFRGLSPSLALLASYGQTGVFLFFLVSAYTLCNSALQRADEKQATRNFFIRRYFRIAPLYYVGMACYLLLQKLLPTESARFLTEQPAANIAANVLLLHGLLPAAFTGVVPGGWSIGTEWLFYLSFPLIFAASLKLQAGFGWKLLLVPIAIVAVLSALNMQQQDISNSLYWFWYDSLLNQLPVFMLGITLFFAIRANDFSPRLSRDVPAFLVVTTAGLWLLSKSLFIALPLVSALSFVFLFNICRSTSRDIGWIERVGQLSYSMYVFHFIFVMVASKLVSVLMPAEVMGEEAAYAVASMLSIFTTYVLATLTQPLIEQRFIAYGRQLVEH